jgi:hypothetical protein
MFPCLTDNEVELGIRLSLAFRNVPELQSLSLNIILGLLGYNQNMVGRLRTLPHAPGTEQIPLALPVGSVLDLWPAAIGAPEAITFMIQQRVCNLIGSCEELDYTLQCISRAHWRAVSRWRDTR